MKKLCSLLLVFVLLASAAPAVTLAAGATAQPTQSKVLINGKNTAFDAYNINGNNYFKLRDLAYALSGTPKQFDVGWDAAKNAISLASGKPYTITGGEMASKGSGNKTASPTSSKIYLDGKEVSFTAYNIDGNNYFKLRDIGQAINFGVGWDAASNTVTIDMKTGYSDSGGQAMKLPQIDSSTARVPITNAIYNLFTGAYGYAGPFPLCSMTHGAWLNLADKKADIIFLVAPTQDELAYFTRRNVDIETKVYGRDGLVFIGNKSNPVKNLTAGQIRDIYSKKITNWKTLGGKDAAIEPFVRDPESGSQRVFEDLVWPGYPMPDFTAAAFQTGDFGFYYTMDGITYDVIGHQNAIGYNYMSYIDWNFADAPLKLFSVNGVAPSTANFASGAYPFLTTSYVAIRADEPADSPARKLYNWVGGAESKTLIQNNSSLYVTFSDSVVIRAPSGKPEQNQALSDMIKSLNSRNLTRQDLYQFTLDEIGFLRNGVYALSGKKFQTAKYAQYFGAQGWYKGISANDADVSAMFNQYQKDNLKLITGYEKELNQAIGNP